MSTRIWALGGAAAHLGASHSATYSGGGGGGSSTARLTRLSQWGGSGAGGGGAWRRGRRRLGMSIYAKIWTNDGRRKAAEMMGLTMEVNCVPLHTHPPVASSARLRR